MPKIENKIYIAFSTILSPTLDLRVEDLPLKSSFFPPINNKIRVQRAKVQKHIDKKDINFSENAMEDRMIKALIEKKFKDEQSLRKLKTGESKYIRLVIEEKGFNSEILTDLKKSEIDTIGVFIHTNPSLVAQKVDTKDETFFAVYQYFGSKILEDLKVALENPEKIIERAINRWFQLYENQEEELLRGDFKDFIQFQDKERKVLIFYREHQDNPIYEGVKQKVKEPEKVHGYEVAWEIETDWDFWSKIMNKIKAYTTKKIIGTIPLVGNLTGQFVSNLMENKNEKDLESTVNTQFSQIFRSLLKDNIAIEYIKYNQEPIEQGKYLP